MSTTTTPTPGCGPTACDQDCGSCEHCRESDHHWPKCHCPTCSEAARLDPGSTFRLPGLSRDGSER